LPTPQCAFHSLTGLPCPTCGATRAAWQFLHGHFAASLRFNPLAFLAYCGIVVFDLYALVALILRAPRLRLINFTLNERIFLRSLAVALIAANWLYLLATRPF
jgi:hydrogenase-4 membrane subunit HyfE